MSEAENKAEASAPLQQKQGDRRGSFKRLLTYTLRSPWLLLMGLLGMLVSTLAMIYLPYVCGKLIDDIRLGEGLTKGLTELGLSALGTVVFGVLRAGCFGLLGERVMLALRTELFNSLVSKDIYFYDTNKSGELVSRLASDITVVQSAASDNISFLIRSILQFLGSLILLWVLCWKLTVIILVLGPLFSLGFIIIGKQFKEAKKLYQDRLAEANAHAAEVFGNIRTTKSFGCEEKEDLQFSKLMQVVYRVGRRSAVLYGLFLAFAFTFANCIIFLVLAYGGFLVFENELSIGELTSYVLYAITLTINLTSASGTVNEMVTAAGVVEKVFQLMDEPVSVVGGEVKLVSNNCGEIEFENVQFEYPGKKDVLVFKNLSLKIRKGESVALVGISGAGKSSLVGLIQRYYDIKAGRLLIDGIDIKSLDVTSLRSNIGLVSQEPVLFSGTLRSNITYSLAESPADSVIEEALRKSNAAEFVNNKAMFPEGLETVVGERGVKLSGGQKQRIAIARAVIKNPEILIFDEATSALDAESEGQVQDSITNIMSLHERTVIIIAHRLSTIINCDRIIVLKDGAVAEEGSHKSLLEAKGVYFAMVQRQLSNVND